MPHPLDLISLVLGILFTLRLMDVTQREAASFPTVPAAEFARWWQRARGAYRLGVSACFGKILLDLIVSYIMRHQPMPMTARMVIGISLDLGWLVLVVLAVWNSRRAHELARELGIELRAKKQTEA